jgi:chromosome segregation ATPase
MTQAAKVEETVGRIEKLTQEAAADLETAGTTRQEAERETAKLTKNAAALLEGVRGHVELLGARKKELETFEERLRVLQNGVGDAEGRLNALMSKDKHVDLLSQKIDAFGKRFDTLFTQADDLTQKQLALDGLAGKLSQLEDLAKKTVWQMDTLRQSRHDLDALRQDMQDFHKVHGEAVKLADRLGADRAALDVFAQKMIGFSARTPELEGKLDAIAAKLKLVEEGTEKATRLHESVARAGRAHRKRLSASAVRREARARINTLHTTAADVDQKLAEQLTRRAELDALRVACDGLGTRLEDAQHQLASVGALQKRLVPMVADVNALKAEIGTASQRLSR